MAGNKSGFLLKSGARTNDYQTFLRDRDPAKFARIEQDRMNFRSAARAARKEGGSFAKGAMHSKLGKLAALVGVGATAASTLKPSTASASEAGDQSWKINPKTGKEFDKYSGDWTDKIVGTAEGGLAATVGRLMWKDGKKGAIGAPRSMIGRGMLKMSGGALMAAGGVMLAGALLGKAHADELNAKHSEKEARHADTPSVAPPSTPKSIGPVGNLVLAGMNAHGMANFATLARRSKTLKGKLGWAAGAALTAAGFAGAISSFASAKEAPKNPTGKSASPADLAQYKKNVLGAKYMTGSAGDVHPAVAKMYEKADNARTDVAAEKSNPALRAAFQAGRKEKAAKAERENARNGVTELRKGLKGVANQKNNRNNPARAARDKVQFGIERGKAHSDLRAAQKKSAPAAEAKHERHAAEKRGHLAGWNVTNAKGKTFWRRANFNQKD
ncbi:hypothetical protein [Hyphomicrobium sp.]|uniref:hypothetical protein n=1 Tax=Hyphomicrobium sp. TaxID=82 RepID=UPI001E146187|nr:hypothetical protein [Hyphomicrobium sp.]MBY0562440.1 hypothetical protein [Hyphomicrobium sp.]